MTSPREKPILLVDPRVGSGELSVILSAKGIPCELASPELYSGDFAFGGYGPKGKGIIGIERKRIPDIVECLYTGRYVGRQLIGMTEDYDLSYLLIEGEARADPETGALQILTRHGHWHNLSTAEHPISYAAFAGHLLTLTHRTPPTVWRTVNLYETCSMIHAIWEWHRKPFGEHRSFEGFHRSRPPVPTFQTGPLSPVRLVAKEIPHIGWEKSRWAESRFKSVLQMAAAGVQEWMTVPGVGPTIAKRAVEWLQGGPDKP